MKISNETKVGLLAATAIVMLIFGYSYLKGKKLFGTENTYYAVFNKVDGLLAANPVLVHGLQVGLVEGIKLKEDEMDKVVVQFVVEDYIKVPKNASIQIVSTGLLGDKAMELSLPAPKDGYAESGGYIEGVDEKSLTDLALETVMPLKDKAESLADSLDAALFKINKLLRSDEMQTTMENVSLSVANVQGTLANVESIVENINEFTENDLQRVGTIMANIEAISESLEQDMVQVRSILNNTQVASKK